MQPPRWLTISKRSSTPGWHNTKPATAAGRRMADRRNCAAQVPTASLTHFFVKLFFAAPASFFSAACASHAVLASLPHLVRKLFSAAPCRFFSARLRLAGRALREGCRCEARKQRHQKQFFHEVLLMLRFKRTIAVRPNRKGIYPAIGNQIRNCAMPRRSSGGRNPHGTDGRDAVRPVRRQCAGRIPACFHPRRSIRSFQFRTGGEAQRQPAQRRRHQYLAAQAGRRLDPECFVQSILLFGRARRNARDP